MSTENEVRPQVSGEGGLEGRVPKLKTNYLQEMKSDQDIYAGVKAAGAASKVYGRYSKWVLYIRFVVTSTAGSLRAHTNR